MRVYLCSECGQVVTQWRAIERKTGVVHVRRIWHSASQMYVTSECGPCGLVHETTHEEDLERARKVWEGTTEDDD